MQKSYKSYFFGAGEVPELLSSLQQRGASITLDRDELVIRAPQGALTTDLIDSLKSHKQAIVEYLEPKVNEFLKPWLNRVRSTVTIADLSAVLADFQPSPRALVERARFSAVYTPIALQLINKTNADKYRTLEVLAEHCWAPYRKDASE